MARVRAKELLFDGTALRQEGEEFEFDGAPAPHIEFLDAAEEKAAGEKLKAAKAAKIIGSLEAEIRAEIEAKARAEFEGKLRAELEAKVRAEVKASLEAAGKSEAASLV
jgi:hypothetical protein